MLTDPEIMDLVSNLTAELVRIPSQGGVDSVDRIVNFVAAQLAGRKLNPESLVDPEGRDVGVYARLQTARKARWGGGFDGDARRVDGPCLCLNACIDTAPIGDADAWSHGPFSADRVDERLYGRGAADSKVGCAMFLTLAGEFWSEGFPRTGTLDVLFDADEHTGRFGGIKSYIKEAGKPDAVAIGYPGNDRIMTGARGFLRAVVTTFGRAEHSGSRHEEKSNAILKMARLVTALGQQPMPLESDSDFPLGPKLSITAIVGGEGFSQIPDRCTCHVDVRLTPHFDAEAGMKLVTEVICRVEDEDRDRSSGDPESDRSIQVEWLESWPPYRIARREPLVGALRKAAEKEFRREIPTAVSGASNVGNYLKKVGVPALCGFGVTYRNLHAIDEFIDTSTIVPAYRAYREAVRHYFRDHSSRRPWGRR